MKKLLLFLTGILSVGIAQADITSLTFCETDPAYTLYVMDPSIHVSGGCISLPLKGNCLKIENGPLNGAYMCSIYMKEPFEFSEQIAQAIVKDNQISLHRESFDYLVNRVDTKITVTPLTLR